MRKGRLLIVMVLMSCACGILEAQESGASLTMASVVRRILERNPQAVVSRLSVEAAHETYRSQWAQALPQITFDLDPAYGINRTQYPNLTVDTGTLPYTIITQYESQTKQRIGEGLTVSQALPTAGSLSLSLRNSTTIAQTATGGTTTTEISQAPQLSLSVSQPVFVNDKLIDLELFPATLRSTELPYLKSLEQDSSLRNTIVTQGIATYLSVVGLRKQLDQMNRYRSVLRQGLDHVRLAHANGSATENDVLSALLSVDRQSEAILELRYSLMQSERALARAIGSDTSLDSTPLSDRLPRVAVNQTAGQIFEKASAKNPEIVQGRLEVENARAQGVIGGQAYAPSLVLSLSVAPQYGATRPDSNLLSNSFSQLFDSGAYTDVTFSMGMHVPLYNGGRYRKDRAALQASVRIAETNLSSKLAIERDNVDSLFLKREYLAAKLTLTEGNVRLEERRLADQKRLLGLSRATDLDVATAESQLESRRIDLWNARVDLFLNSLDILSLAGGDISQLVAKESPQ